MQTVTEDGEVIELASTQAIPQDPPFWKTPWNHDTKAESDRLGLECKDPSKTKQEFASDADINNILRKFLNTGEMNLTGMPVYQDIEEEFDLQNSIVTGAQVEEAWNALPAAVRNILKDPKTFTDYVSHCMETGDLDPLRELGLANPKPPSEPIGVAPATPIPAPTSATPAPSSPSAASSGTT